MEENFSNLVFIFYQGLLQSKIGSFEERWKECDDSSLLCNDEIETLWRQWCKITTVFCCRTHDWGHFLVKSVMQSIVLRDQIAQKSIAFQELQQVKSKDTVLVSWHLRLVRATYAVLVEMQWLESGKSIHWNLSWFLEVIEGQSWLSLV